MKTVDLSSGEHSLIEVLKLAKSEAVLIRSSSGEDFLLEHADEFDREVASLGASEKFTSFLEGRSKESGDLSLKEVRRKYGAQKNRKKG
jgi:hypothetical protein